MMEMVTGGALGLLLGIGLQRCALTARYTVRRNMALHQRDLLRRVLMLTGWATVLTAFLCWLAVIDVDTLRVLPLNAGTLAGAVVFGVAAGATGLLPGTVPGSIGGGRGLEGLCALAGCALGALLLRKGQPLLIRLQEVLPLSAATLFRVTLDEPYLLPGGFLAQGCVGCVLMAVALLIPKDPAPDQPAPVVPDAPAPDVSLDAQDVQADTVIALLPGEEPLTVDTAAQDGEPAEDDAPEDADAPEEAVQQDTSDDAGEDASEDESAPQDAEADVSDAATIDAAAEKDDTEDESDPQDAKHDAPDASPAEEPAAPPPGEDDHLG